MLGLPTPMPRLLFPQAVAAAAGLNFTKWEFSFRTRIGNRKFESVTPTNRIPLCGGKTVRINSRASSCSLSLVSIGVSTDRLREDIWKFAHLIFTVTVRPRQFVFSHQAQTSSAIAITPASI